MLTVASLLWEPNTNSYYFSRCYNESWVLKLYEGFNRNLTVPWRFVLWTDKERELPSFIKQEKIRSDPPDYGACIEPYRYGCPMILVGLDTVIVGNIDHMAEYCLTKNKLALPKDPNQKTVACNGVQLIPANHQHLYRNWHGENDMLYLRQQPHEYLDDLFPGQVLSYKCNVKKGGLGDARIVYFHGQEKPHELDLPWIKQHW